MLHTLLGHLLYRVDLLSPMLLRKNSWTGTMTQVQLVECYHLLLDEYTSPRVRRNQSNKVNPIYGQARAPFAIQYYLVGILFLIFDLEIAVFYPLAVTLYQVSVYGF